MSEAAIRIGIGGPVGSGKTRLLERLLPILARHGHNVVVVTNDLVTKEDAERVKNSGHIDPQRVVGVETGACPHTAIREDPSANLDAISRLIGVYRPDIVLVESGGDNLAATFSPDLVDFWIFVIDCAAGDDIPRKRGLGVLNADLVLVNKMDLAPYVGASLSVIERDMNVVRRGRPWVFTNLQEAESAETVYGTLTQCLPI